MNDFKLDKGQKIFTGFTTPNDYFDNFTDALMGHLPAREVKIIPLYKRKPLWLFAAAGFIVIAGLSALYTTNMASQPDDAAIENYLVYQANVNSYDLMQNLDQNDIDELEKSIVINDEQIKDYLVDEDVYINE
jgi:hypothetical protein